ncbi:MAG: putative ABC exporter domain-containing protein [Longicatena sp.]
MKALIYLYFLRMKGNVRNVFSKLGSALFAIFLILVYGGMFIGLLMNPDIALSVMNINKINSVIFVGIGFTALMVTMMLMQTRKSLFMENDAFYLFSGPFKRKHAMQFIMSQSIVGSLLCGAVSLFMMVMLGSSLEYNVWFLFLNFLAHSLVYFFFTILYYYVYLLSIKDKKYKYLSIYILGLYVVLVAAIFIYSLAQNDFILKDGVMKFLESDVFYFVPLFGWIKLILVNSIMGNTIYMLLGLFLLVGSCIGIYVLMCNYKGAFVEKAMEDAIEFTKRYKEVKAGNRSSMNDKKVRDVKSNFKEGAAAIYSKNLLLMKKTNSFLQIQDFIFLGVYLVISMISDLGFGFFMYMIIFWLFLTTQNSEFMKEMNNYQIYLIPDKPIRKLLYLVLPYIMKNMIVILFPVIVGMILLQGNIMDAIQYYIMLAGYACLFISASVLATRLLKSRNNAIMENMIRMLICGLAAVPSIILIVVMFNLGVFNTTLILMISLLSLLMNFVISALILYGCRNMMNGREVKSE